MGTYDLASQTARYDQARAIARWDVRNRHPLTHHNHNHNNNNNRNNFTNKIMPKRPTPRCIIPIS